MLLSNILFIAALVWMSLFTVKLSKSMNTIQRKFFTLSSLFLTGWVLFDFLTANAWSIQTASLFYSLSMLCISIMVGFFYLTSMSFTKTLTGKDYLIALIPFIINTPRTMYQVINKTTSTYQISYTVIDYIWIISCALIALIGVYKLFRLSEKVHKRELKKKLTMLSATLFLIIVLSPLSTVLMNSLGVIDITSVIASFLFSLNYRLFK